MNATTETCAFANCTHPPAKLPSQPGRPPAFCALPEHNAATAWLARYAAKSGSTVQVVQLPDSAGFVWEATGADGTPGASEEPHGSWEEAVDDAQVFLDRHADPDGADPHADCLQPHRNSEGEYVDCDGRPL